MTVHEAKQYSPAALAFLGDSVYDTQIRAFLLRAANRQAQKLHEEKIRLVCAAQQAQAAQHILPLLTEEEAAVFRRGKNADVQVPRHTPAGVYHLATGLEAVFGYLWLLGAQARIDELTTRILENED